MQIETLDIAGPLVLRPKRFTDDRGWFSETWSKRALEDARVEASFVQDNVSVSRNAGTLRGLHCQKAPFAQGKLILLITGSVLDVAVDVRHGSSTYGRHVTRTLCEEDPAQIWVPPGFLHGFVTLRPDTRVLYKVTAPYSQAHERAVAWNDPDLGIDWGLQDPILSAKDARAPRLKELDPLFPWMELDDAR